MPPDSPGKAARNPHPTNLRSKRIVDRLTIPRQSDPSRRRRIDCQRLIVRIGWCYCQNIVARRIYDSANSDVAVEQFIAGLNAFCFTFITSEASSAFSAILGSRDDFLTGVAAFFEADCASEVKA